MNIGAIVRAAAGFAVQLLGSIKGSDHKPTFTDLVPTMLGSVLPALEQAMKFQNLDTKEKVDSWLTLADLATGVETTAPNLIHDMPRELQEQMFDHVLEAARIYAYCKLGVPGFSAP